MSERRTYPQDLTGEEFGRLTVVSEAAERSADRRVQWHCVCACPAKTRVTVTRNNLIRGNSTSCGCRRRENVSAARTHDLTNQQFGLLKAIRLTGRRGKEGGHIWECACACGGTKEVRSVHLVTGGAVSCGCVTPADLDWSDLGVHAAHKIRNRRAREKAKLQKASVF